MFKEHPGFTIYDWKYHVATDKTLLSYAHWVRENLTRERAEYIPPTMTPLPKLDCALCHGTGWHETATGREVCDRCYEVERRNGRLRIKRPDEIRRCQMCGAIEHQLHHDPGRVVADLGPGKYLRVRLINSRLRGQLECQLCNAAQALIRNNEKRRKARKYEVK
jgi:hypothetical protein